MAKSTTATDKQAIERLIRATIQDATAAFNRGDYGQAAKVMADAVVKVSATASKLGDLPKLSKGPYGLRENERVRFAKDLKGRKASLFTRLVDGVVYFGIARCNRAAGDEFDSELGVNLARSRAIQVEKKISPVVNGMDGLDTLFVTGDGVAGKCDVEDVVDMLDYFYQATAR